MYLITGANGQLGRLVIRALLERVPADQIIAAVRRPESVDDLRNLGVQVRAADYNAPEQWPSALEGVERVLLIATSEMSRRDEQHRMVVDAVAAAPSVRRFAYTSLLQLENSSYRQAESERALEAVARQLPITTVMLRNGWYTENYTEMLAASKEAGALRGMAGDGRISAATRADYAEAAAVALTIDEPEEAYELAGDTAFTLAEVAAGFSTQTGQCITYQDLDEVDYIALIESWGWGADVATILADGDRVARLGEVENHDRQLSKLIGRPTTPLSTAVAAAVAEFSS